MDAVYVKNGVVDAVVLNAKGSPAGAIMVESGTVYGGWLYANGNFLPPSEPSPVLTRVPKYTLIDRLTDEEGNKLLADFNDAPGKLAFLWNSIMNIDTADPYYPVLRGVIVNTLGEDRAAEVLAPTE